VQAPGLPKYQLHAATETEYFTEEIKARFTFKPDASGKTDQLDVSFEGQLIATKRVISNE
jgi:hypothetical protein